MAAGGKTPAERCGVFAPRSVWTNQARTALLTADLPIRPSRVDSLTTEIFRRHLFSWSHTLRPKTSTDRVIEARLPSFAVPGFACCHLSRRLITPRH